MSANEEIIIRAILAGTREYLAHSQQVVAGNEEIAASTEATGRAMATATKRGYLMNQALFTVRRLMYGVTLATIASGVAAVKWGFDFNSAMQSARVALMPLQSATFNVNRELDYLFNFTKYTPFQFKDVTIAFRQLYGSMHPLGISAGEVNGYLKAITDALSFVGKTSPGQLNRVSTALAHVAFQGKLTGQAVQQLARDGLPIYPALQKELGLTAEQMHAVGKLAIPVDVAMKALHDYIESTPGFMNAAHRQATMTFHGLFTTFKDNTAQIMGYVEKGFFRHMQDRLREMNHWFDRVGRVAKDSGGSMVAIMDAIGGHGAVMMWTRLTDVAHQFWLIFVNISSSIAKSQMFWAALYTVLTLISIVLHLINPFLEVFGGTLVTFLVPAIITWYTVTKIAAFWTGVLTLEEVLATKATKDLTFAQFLAAIVTGRYTIALRIATAATIIYSAVQAALYTWFLRLRVAAAELWLMLELNPIILIVSAVVLLTAGLVILYFKWQAFHDLVNRTWNWITNNKLVVAAALSTMFFPLVAAYETLKHIGDLLHAIGRVGRWLFGGGGPKPQTFSGNAPLPHTYNSGYHFATGPLFPRQAAGGMVMRPGLSWVGEYGPELLALPAGATIAPRQNAFNYASSWLGTQTGKGETKIIRVQIGRKTLVDIVAEEVASAQARS